MKRLLLLAFLAFLIPHSASATVYYVDFTNGKDTNTGLGTTSALAFQSLNQFANNARSAGDIAFVRRGQASTTNVTAVTFTSDGTLNAPITISADYDNLWSDFATSSVTGTATFGSTYIATSASTTDAYPKTWVYFQGDCSETYNASTTNPCQYAYEVKSASSTGIDFYLPYKGNQSGAGLNIRVMPAAPIVGDPTQANQIFTMATDDYWYFKGLNLLSTNANCPVQSSQNRGTIFFDLIVQGNGAADCGFNSGDYSTIFKKIRAFNIVNLTIGTMSRNRFDDAYVDCNSVALSRVFIVNNRADSANVRNLETVNCTSLIQGPSNGDPLYFTNVKRLDPSSSNTSGSAIDYIYFDDDFGIPGLNSQSSSAISSNALGTTTISTTTVTRSGGGPSTQYVIPPAGTGNTGISTRYFPFSYMKLGEWGFYAAANVSKTYTVYFRTSSTSAFTRNPFTDTQAGSSTPELFVECEYYKDASDADRQLKRSNTAGAVSFTSDTNWYGVSVTCQPTQSGVLYLRAWYAKPKESPTNQFYLDTNPTFI